MDNYYVSKLMPLIAEAGVRGDRQSADQHHDPGPPRHLSQAPRHDARARADGGGHRRRVRPRLRDGPVVPLGSADMLEVAHMGLHVAQMTGQEAMRACFDAVTTVPAKILGLEGYGLAPGCDADFVLLRSARSRRGDPAQGDAARRRAPRAASSRARRPLPPRSTSRAGRRSPVTGPGSEGARVSLSVIVIAKDEEASIARTLESVAFADEVVVVDSGSTDRTVDIARELGAKVTVTADWPGFGRAEESRARSRDRRLGALARCRRMADRRICRGDKAGRSSANAADVAAYRMPRRSSFCGRFLRHSGWWPDYVLRLFRRGRGRFSDDAVHERVIADGKIGDPCRADHARNVRRPR